MFQGLPEAKTCIILVKIEIFYYKNYLRFALSGKTSEENLYTNSYTGKNDRLRRPITLPTGFPLGPKKFM